MELEKPRNCCSIYSRNWNCCCYHCFPTYSASPSSLTYFIIRTKLLDHGSTQENFQDIHRWLAYFPQGERSNWFGWDGWATDPIYRREKNQESEHTSKTSWCMSEEEQRHNKGKLTKKVKKWRNQEETGKERGILNRMNSWQKEDWGSQLENHKCNYEWNHGRG